MSVSIAVILFNKVRAPRECTARSAAGCRRFLLTRPSSPLTQPATPLLASSRASFVQWILAYSEFPYPLALTMWHMIFCSFVGIMLASRETGMASGSRAPTPPTFPSPF